MWSSLFVLFVTLNLNLLFRSRIEADLRLGFYNLKMPKGRYVDTLTINWHITEACNFQCKYCFAKWTRHDQKEILHMPSKVGLLLEEISQLPSLLDFKVLRLNLVGGEIFLYPKPLLHILQEAKTRNMHLSAITNGSLLNQRLNELIATYFKNIGFSVDSLNATRTQPLGVALREKQWISHKLKRILIPFARAIPKYN